MSIIDTKFGIFGGIVAIWVHSVTTAYFENILNNKRCIIPAQATEIQCLCIKTHNIHTIDCIIITTF